MKNPIQNLYKEIEKILNFIELKDEKEASYHEAKISDKQSEIWMNALTRNDTYVSYSNWWSYYMFQQIDPTVSLTDVKEWSNNPYNVPFKYRDLLLKLGREEFLSQYVELNDYYLMINGMPPSDENPTNYIYPSEDFRKKYNIDIIPIHEISDYYQNIFMKTDEYQNVLKNNPDKRYLKYLGINKIDIFKARNAKDFDIIRYPYNIFDINSNLLITFAEIYKSCREYVMTVLFNKNLDDIYPGYREFVGLIIMVYTIMQVTNRSLEGVKDLNFFDDSIIHTILSMYNIPSNISISKKIKRILTRSLPTLIENKATDDIYYDLISILQYDDVKVNKLLLVRNKSLKNKKITNEMLLDTERIHEGVPYFVKTDIRESDIYSVVINPKNKKYSYGEITEKDPMWLNTSDVIEKVLSENYSVTDSKFISFDINIHQDRFMMESIIFPRMILDNKDLTDKVKLNIAPLIDKEITLYEAMLYVICSSCLINKSSGRIYYDTEDLIPIFGFNFDLNIDDVLEFVNSAKYIDREKIKVFLQSLVIVAESDIYRVYNTITPMREWLQYKISLSNNREEYNNYIKIYQSLFTYDITRNKMLDNFEKPIQKIKKKYSISDEDFNTLINFYPHVGDKALTIKEFNGSNNKSPYNYPFLSIDNQISWFINVSIETQYGEEDRGNLYIYDILTCEDCLDLTNPNGTRIFTDYINNEDGWVINKKAVEKAIQQLNEISEKELENAYFQITTIGKNGEVYDKNKQLPATMRYGLFKTIIVEKIKMDTSGYAKYPKTYFEELKRENEDLYKLLLKYNYLTNPTEWSNTLYTIVNAIESKLNIYLRYFEKSVLGNEVFFKPLLDLVRRFKSNLVEYIGFDYSYIFGDKIDAGGNSNLLKLFDESSFKMHIDNRKDKVEGLLGLYDAKKSSKIKNIINDRSTLVSMTVGEGFVAEKREIEMGSLRMTDVLKFKKNGKEIDPDNQPSHWISGEHNTGEWDDEMKHIMKIRKENVEIQNHDIDMDAWKNYVPSKN